MSEKKVFAELVLSPKGQVYLDYSTQAREELPFAEFEKIQALFVKDSAAGLLHLGIQELSASFPLSFAFWQTFSRHFIAQVCKLACDLESQESLAIPVPDSMFFSETTHRAFFMRGIEYLTTETLTVVWQNLAECLQQELKDLSVSLHILQAARH